MEGSKASIWVGFNVGKANFSVSQDQLTENGRVKITTLPCRDFKRTPEGVEQFCQERHYVEAYKNEDFI